MYIILIDKGLRERAPAAHRLARLGVVDAAARVHQARNVLLGLCIYIYIYIYVHIYMCVVCMQIYILYIYICMYVCMYVCM